MTHMVILMFKLETSETWETDLAAFSMLFTTSKIIWASYGEDLTCLLYYILYCFPESICPTRFATTSCSREHHPLVVTSRCLLVWSAVNCIDSLPFRALTHHYNCCDIFYIVNRCGHSQHYFNPASNSSKRKIRANLSLADAVNNILGTSGAKLGKNQNYWSSCHNISKSPFFVVVLQLIEH